MNDSFRWSKMQMMQKALFVLLLVLSACTGEEKATIPDEPETPEAKITLAEGSEHTQRKQREPQEVLLGKRLQAPRSEGTCEYDDG